MILYTFKVLMLFFINLPSSFTFNCSPSLVPARFPKLFCLSVSESRRFVGVRAACIHRPRALDPGRSNGSGCVCVSVSGCGCVCVGGERRHKLVTFATQLMARQLISLILQSEACAHSTLSLSSVSSLRLALLRPVVFLTGGYYYYGVKAENKKREARKVAKWM